MKKVISIATCLLILTAGNVQADGSKHKYKNYGNSSSSQYKTAKVIRVRPIYREVRINNPVTECWDEPVVHTKHKRHSSSAGGTLAGGIIGGIIGHQIGKGRGKKVATALGTIIGAQVGHDASKHRHSRKHQQVSYEEHCRTVQHVDYEEVVDGYHVTYKFMGERYDIEMPYHPGKRIKMRVEFTPVI